MKAATSRGLDYIFNLFISIHAAREGGDVDFQRARPPHTISIHAAREGGDCYTSVIYSIVKLFQSTPPVKAATGFGRSQRAGVKISIHAAREGGDPIVLPLPPQCPDFNPRRP